MRYTLDTRLGVEVILVPTTDGAPERWMHDPEITEHNAHGLFLYTKKQREAFTAAAERGEAILWNIIQDGCRIGQICLRSINLMNRSAEITIVIGDKKSWGKGIASRAMETVVHHAHSVLGLHRVWTGTAATNKGMRRVCEKVGMDHEGTFHDAMWLNGRFVDIEVYAKVYTKPVPVL